MKFPLLGGRWTIHKLLFVSVSIWRNANTSGTNVATGMDPFKTQARVHISYDVKHLFVASTCKCNFLKKNNMYRKLCIHLYPVHVCFACVCFNNVPFSCATFPKHRSPAGTWGARTPGEVERGGIHGSPGAAKPEGFAATDGFTTS